MAEHESAYITWARNSTQEERSSTEKTCNKYANAPIAPVSCPRNRHVFGCDQNGPSARRSEPDWHMEGAYLNGYVTDPAVTRQPPAHFHRNPLGRGQLAVFPFRHRGTRSSRIDSR